MKKLWVNVVPYKKEIAIAALAAGAAGVSIGRNAFQVSGAKYRTLQDYRAKILEKISHREKN